MRWLKMCSLCLIQISYLFKLSFLGEGVIGGGIILQHQTVEYFDEKKFNQNYKKLFYKFLKIIKIIYLKKNDSQL